jgi:hypothetical protein
MIRLLTLGAFAAAAILATPQDASAKSPFCFGGSPTPKHICDAIKANEKKKPLSVGGGATSYASQKPTRR